MTRQLIAPPLSSTFDEIYSVIDQEPNKQSPELVTTGGKEFVAVAGVTKDRRRFILLPHSNRIYEHDWGYTTNSMGKNGQRIGHYSVPLDKWRLREYGKDWSHSELDAAVDAYLWMFNQEIQSKHYSKADINRQLRESQLSSRSKSSIEYRMQNISAVMEELCLPRIAGYQPAKNVGAKVKDRIRAVLADKAAFNPADYAPSADEKALSQQVSNLCRRPLIGIPRGNKTPQRINGSTSSFVRDPLVKAWVLQNAKGICESCRQPAPFKRKDGSPFLEVHHVHTLVEGGSDQISNAVALCPNCHRRCHLSDDLKTFVSSLYSTIPRLVPE